MSIVNPDGCFYHSDLFTSHWLSRDRNTSSSARISNSVPALYLSRIIDLFYWMINLYYCSCSSDPVSCARIKARISVPLSSARSSAASLQAQINSSQIGFCIWSFVIKHESLSEFAFCLLISQTVGEVHKKFIPINEAAKLHTVLDRSKLASPNNMDKKRGSHTADII